MIELKKQILDQQKESDLSIGKHLALTEEFKQYCIRYMKVFKQELNDKIKQAGEIDDAQIADLIISEISQAISASKIDTVWNFEEKKNTNSRNPQQSFYENEEQKFLDELFNGAGFVNTGITDPKTQSSLIHHKIFPSTKPEEPSKLKEILTPLDAQRGYFFRKKFSFSNCFDEVKNLRLPPDMVNEKIEILQGMLFAMAKELELSNKARQALSDKLITGAVYAVLAMSSEDITKMREGMEKSKTSSLFEHAVKLCKQDKKSLQQNLKSHNETMPPKAEISIGMSLKNQITQKNQLMLDARQSKLSSLFSRVGQMITSRRTNRS